MFTQFYLMILSLIIIGFVYLSLRSRSMRKSQPQICVILGSGGHTTQMCELLRKFNFQKCSRINVVIGSSDHLSEAFFTNYFKQVNKNFLEKVIFLKTKRTNQVKQSQITSILTTILATVYIFFLMIKRLLGVTHLVSNGPGICVPFFFLFWFLNKIKITQTKLIFVESWCRVTTLSVTGRLISSISDQFLVHWQNQDKMAKGVKYVGQII